MGLLIATDNLLTALGITNKEQFDQAFADFSEFETFVEKCGYEYDFDEEGNLILITPNSKEINTGINGFIDYSDYLTFEALEDGTFTMTLTAKLPTTCVESVSYSIDNGETWVTTNNVDNTIVTITTPTIMQGNKVIWKGTGVQYYTNTDAYPGSNMGKGYFTSTNNFNVSGNIMSLLYNDDFNDKVTLPERITTGYESSIFGYLFSNCKIISANDLKLPATTLVNYCYLDMFSGCTSLTTAPELPATTLASNCYSEMFNRCTSLSSAPELPATTLASNCYARMFAGCTSLTTAPELPVNTLASGCYSGMFRDCTSLTTAPELPATTLTNSCYIFMFDGCTSLTTAPELPATTLTSDCYSYMFQNCTSLTTVPELPATTLASSCYSYMFQNCTSLTTAPELPATTLASSCYLDMFSGCTSLTTAPELPATTLAEYCYNSMFYGCTSLTTAPELPATTMITQCYRSMFQNCTSLTSAPSVLPATTLANYCYISMFKGCTHLTKAPKLPATTLVDNCYYQMFQNCTSLNNITMLAEIFVNNCFTNWVSGVASTGTFTKAVNTTLPTGNSGIPTGWTVELVDS